LVFVQNFGLEALFYFIKLPKVWALCSNYHIGPLHLGLKMEDFCLDNRHFEKQEKIELMQWGSKAEKAIVQ
jgi:hypothetical protein